MPQVPTDVLGRLLVGFAERQAELVLADSGSSRDDPDHLPRLITSGASLDEILAWLWSADPDEAIAFLGAFLDALRRRQTSQGEPRSTLDELLSTLETFPPRHFEHDTAELGRLLGQTRAVLLDWEPDLNTPERPNQPWSRRDSSES